jgi:MoxR-like ATPase
MLKEIHTLKSDLNAQFPERKEVIHGSLAAVLASEHVLLLGPPGTAKSALVRSIAQAFSCTYFERLLTKFSTPEELFGAISLKALEQDRFSRITTGKLPEAELAFVDEVFKGNSAILNSLLSLVNERVFHNDDAPMKCPLVSMFGASNELPEGKELEAVFDRFLLRYDVNYLLRPSSFRCVVMSGDPAVTVGLTRKQLAQAQKEASAVKLTDETVEAMITIRDACKAEGITASDRRWKKLTKVAQATAYMAGATETAPEDLSILVDSLWREPKERTKLAKVVGRIADPVGAQANEILDAARETAGKVSAIKTTDRKQYVNQAAAALEQFNAQQAKLAGLARSAGERSKAVVGDAITEINGLHAELARVVSQGLGLGMRVAK